MALNERPYEEKRNFVRVTVDYEVTLEQVSSGRRFIGAGKNLSASGLLFHTDEELVPGDMLEIHIETGPALLNALDASIEVVRVEPLRKQARYAVGGAILNIHKP